MKLIFKNHVFFFNPYTSSDVIYSGGCVDSLHQYLVLLFMALTQNNISSVRLGPLTPYTISFLRNLKLFLVSAEKLIKT